MVDDTTHNNNLSGLYSVKNLTVANKADLVARDNRSNKHSNKRLCIPSLNLQSGQFIAIVGPNGAGKSTLLHCLAGGIDFSGNVDYQQTDIVKARNSASASLVASLGVLPQTNLMEFNFSVDEVLAFNFSSRVLLAQVRDFVKKIACEITKVSCFLDKPISLLSGGEQQRVHLARVFMQVLPALCCLNLPEVLRLAEELGLADVNVSCADFAAVKSVDFPFPCLLLDEPCASLDLEFQQRLQSYLHRLCTMGLTVIMVTHDLNSALYYSDHLLLMSAGEIFSRGNPEQILTPENIFQVFRIRAELMRHKGRHLLVF